MFDFPALTTLRKRFNPLEERLTQPVSLSSKNRDQCRILILYGSQTGTTQRLAEELHHQLLIQLPLNFQHYVTFKICSIESYPNTKKDSNTSFSNIARFESLIVDFDVLVICISTFTDGLPPPNSLDLFDFLEEFQTDFRIEKNYFASLNGIAIIGCGNKEYKNHFCTPAIKLTKIFKSMGGTCLVPTLKLDDQNDSNVILKKWIKNFLNALFIIRYGKTLLLHQSTNLISNTLLLHKDILFLINYHYSNIIFNDTYRIDHTSDDDDDDDDLSDDDDGSQTTSSLFTCGDNNGKTHDVEDIKNHTMDVTYKNKKFLHESSNQQMLTKRQHAQLEKEGYKIVGSHSAVKLCRWTKSQLRGRGGCYKHTFYGIQSHLCMEATPSLACANKCVFCWRHHKNPVGKSWKWMMDSPDTILKGMKEQHGKMIKQLKGVAGVHLDRFQDSTMAIRHCALSLVGEPIMYPELNTLLDGMHKDHISTFLVTNAQFPEELSHLCPVTQLYISIDAATAESLKKIDQPLFTDFWERFLKCIDIVRSIPSRTVFRLTLVKNYNMEEATKFGQLILRGMPDFIEIKAVTYCGSSTGNISQDQITMKNIPWHEEVVNYGKAILQSNTELAKYYDLASEHKHSCCILIAQKKFYINEKWHTWIDYEKFFQLYENGTIFNTSDYILPTPSWAVYGSVEQGFDPLETRVHTKGKYKRLRDTENLTKEIST